MNPHDIIGSTGQDVECRCGWTGTRDAHALHFTADTAREGIAAARAALETKGRPNLKVVK